MEIKIKYVTTYNSQYLFNTLQKVFFNKIIKKPSKGKFLFPFFT